jgi:hypothetical protein
MSSGFIGRQTVTVSPPRSTAIEPRALECRQHIWALGQRVGDDSTDKEQNAAPRGSQISSVWYHQGS